VKVWDAQTGKELLTLTDGDGGGQVAFSPDGKYLARGVSAAAGLNGEVKVWDAQTGQEIHAFKGRWGRVHSVAFSSDGQRLASGPTGLPGGSLPGAGTPVDRLGDVKVWDLKSGQELLSIKSFATRMAFSPDGKRLAIDSGRGDGLKVWDAETGQELLCIKGDSLTVAFSPDGKRLVGASENYGTVTVWDAQTGQQLLTFRGHTAKVEDVAFSPDGKRLASASSDKTVKVWDAEAGPSPLRITGRFGVVAFSPDGKRIATESKDKTVKVWDAQTRQELFTLQGHSSWVVQAVFSPDGKRLASAGGGAEQGQPLPGEVKVWDAETGQQLFTFKDLSRGSRNVAFSPDGKRLASAGSGAPSPFGSIPSELMVWDVQTGKEIVTLKDLPRGLHGVVFSPDGTRLVGVVAATFRNGQQVTDNAVKVWDAQTGKEMLTLKGSGVVVFSPDGKRLASIKRSDVEVLDAQTGQELLTLKGHTNWVYSVVFSPDGTRLASVSDDKTAKVCPDRQGSLHPQGAQWAAR
jgi:WD40 repeat protein